MISSLATGIHSTTVTAGIFALKVGTDSVMGAFGIGLTLPTLAAYEGVTDVAWRASTNWSVSSGIVVTRSANSIVAAWVR